MGWLAFCHCFLFIWNLPGQFCYFFLNSIVAFVVVFVVVEFIWGVGSLFLLCFFYLPILNIRILLLDATEIFDWNNFILEF